jgi:glycosyltransferase involved in cell wall biosynthesis
MEAMWLPAKKLVVTFHDLFLLTNPECMGHGVGGSGWRNWFGRNYFAFAANLAQAKARGKLFSGIVCVSEKTKQDLMECFGIPGYAIKVIRSGISPYLEPQPKPDGKLRVGYLGQLDRRKRVDVLINAFKGGRLDAELWIAGTGIDELKLRRLAGGDSRIAFLGLIPDSALCKFYNSIDVLMLPTYIEGYGLTAVEAMACKKPVVVLGDSVMPEEIKSRCVVVDGLPTLFAKLGNVVDAIFGVDFDSNYAFAKSHDWEKAVDEYEALYEEVAC